MSLVSQRGYTPIKLDSHSTLATNKTPGISNSYNSPLGLYSQDTLDSIMQENNNNNSNNKSSSNNTQYKPVAVTPDPVMPPTRQVTLQAKSVLMETFLCRQGADTLSHTSIRATHSRR